MKILFPTDGSDASVAALTHLVDRLGWFKDPRIALLNVHFPLPYARAVAWAGRDAVQRYYDEEGDAALASSIAILEAKGIAHEAVRKVGEPAHEIASYAKEWGADLVAMGRRGDSAMAQMLMGSVTQKVIAASPVPVLVFDERSKE